MQIDYDLPSVEMKGFGSGVYMLFFFILLFYLMPRWYYHGGHWMIPGECLCCMIFLSTYRTNEHSVWFISTVYLEVRMPVIEDSDCQVGCSVDRD